MLTGSRCPAVLLSGESEDLAKVGLLIYGFDSSTATPSKAF